MSAVTVALVGGFLCCALAIRVLGARARTRAPGIAAVAATGTASRSTGQRRVRNADSDDRCSARRAMMNR